MNTGVSKHTFLEKLAFLDQWRDSGLTVTAFCRRVEIPRMTFTNWIGQERVAMSVADAILGNNIVKLSCLHPESDHYRVWARNNIATIIVDKKG